MAFVFDGIVETVYDKEVIPTRTGNTIQRRKVVITTVEEYPQRVVVTLVDKLAEDFQLKPGDQMRAYLKFKAYASQDSDVVWNDIRCWKYEKGGAR